MFDPGIKFDLGWAQRSDVSAAVGIQNIFGAPEEVSVGLAIIAEADHSVARAGINVKGCSAELAAVALNGNVHNPVLEEVVTFPYISTEGSVGERKSEFHAAVFSQSGFALSFCGRLFFAEAARVETIFRNAQGR